MGHNPFHHYGKPLIGITVGLAGIFGLALAVGGEAFRAAAVTWIVVLFFHWTVIIYLVWLAFDFRKEAYSLPKVKSLHLNDGFILVSEKDWLGVEVSVLVYKQEGEFERLLCAGTVSNIQQNRLVQIRLVHNVEGEELQQLIDRLNDGKLDSLIVKPGLFIGGKE